MQQSTRTSQQEREFQLKMTSTQYISWILLLHDVSAWLPLAFLVIFETLWPSDKPLRECVLFIATRTERRRVNIFLNNHAIFLNNHAITQVHQHKHLGVKLSSTLSWSPHVEHLISRSSAMLGLLRHLHSYFRFSSRCLLKVYLCYIRPLLEYGWSFVGLSCSLCSPAWSCATEGIVHL